jgi:hypothetical protein
LRLREALRPLELRRLLSLGATLEESLSTRLDSVRAPERLCDREREEELLLREPELERLRELVLERFFEEELWEPPDFLPRRVFDPELVLRCAILLLGSSSVSRARYPRPMAQTRSQPPGNDCSNKVGGLYWVTDRRTM